MHKRQVYAWLATGLVIGLLVVAVGGAILLSGVTVVASSPSEAVVGTTATSTLDEKAESGEVPAIDFTEGIVPGQSALDLPDRTADAVRSEEARITILLKTTPDVWLPGDCDVRLLGQDESASFVWAYCSDGKSGFSGPLRIDGDKVSVPGDGSNYPIDVERMFPTDLADAILDHDERLRPEESQASTIPFD